jgi:SHS2 domain-containing protein
VCDAEELYKNSPQLLFADHHVTMAHSFRFLDDIAVADLAFEGEGDSIEEVFRAATQALLESMANTTTVESTWHRVIERHDEELSQLLFDWLSNIIYWKDAAGVVFHDAPLTIVKKDGLWTLSGRLVGAPVDRLTQELRDDVKGITKHLYELCERDDKWKVRVVVDV